jgi:hypothetical protein
MRISRQAWVGTVVLAAAAACSTGDDSSFPPMGAEGGAPHYDGGGDDATAPDDAGHDGGADALAEASGDDAAAEASGDAAVEASSPEEAGSEAAVSEAGEEAGIDASHEAGEDAGVDAGHDAAPEAEAAAPEAGVDAGADAPPEAAVEAGHDAGADTSTVADTGVDAAEDATADAISIVAPVCDGVIGPNEYGGPGNQAASASGQTWLMTWDDTNLYVAIEGANVDEGSILYFAIAPGSVGGVGAGVTSGELYDSTNVTTLPFTAQLAVYAHDGYTEGRPDNAGAWGAAETTLVRLCDNTTMQVREEVIPWSLLGGKPAAFGWTGYVAANGNTNPTGYIYGQMPTGNPSGAPANNDTFTQYYEVASTATGVATPFAVVQ